MTPKRSNFHSFYKNLRKSAIDDDSMNKKTRVNFSYVGDINNQFGIYRQNIISLKKNIFNPMVVKHSSHDEFICFKMKSYEMINAQFIFI